MDTIQNIKAFLLVARTASITTAARQLGVVPSVVTKRIDRLEDQMRVKLLQRSTRRIALT
ncbi:MAG: LysR family transcriptional regulator, partial [Bradyrhizobium sp.]